MITYKTLLFGVLAIALLVTGAYFFIAPNQDENTNGSENEVILATPTTSDDGTAEGFEDDDSVEESDDIVSTPTPTPAPVPTPKPAPPPAPEPSGPPTYTLAEVALHISESSCWTAIDGKVYDLTPFISRHPGGKSNIMKLCGIDGTIIFYDQHEGDSKPASRLESLYIGDLK